MVRPDNAYKRNQAISAAAGQADIDAQQRALAEGGQEALYREQVAQQLAAHRVNLERQKEAGNISQTEYEQQLKQQQYMVERNSQFYGEALKSSVDAGVSRHRASDRASGQIGESHRFYREIGYSQYAGRYAPFEIPEGHEVRGITEGPEGLNITFVDPAAERQAKEQHAASESFYKSIGFEQYAGRYSPFDIPEGHKVRSITEGPEGLNITFYDPVAEQQAKSQAMASEMFYKSIGFGQFGGKYAPFKIPKDHTIQSITETDTGLSIIFTGPPVSAPTESKQAQIHLAPQQSAEQSQAPLVPTYAEVAAPQQLSNIEKVMLGELGFDSLTTEEQNELYMITSSKSMAPIQSIKNAVAQLQSKKEQKDTLKESKSGLTVNMNMVAKAEKDFAKTAKVDQAPKVTQTNVIGNILADPLGSLGGAVSFMSQVTAKDTSPLGQFVNYKTGEALSLVNMANEVKASVAGIFKGKTLQPTTQVIPTQPVLSSMYNKPEYTVLTPKSETQKIGETSGKVQVGLAAAIAAPVLGPSVGVSSGSIVAGELINVGVNQAVKAYGVSQTQGAKPEDYLLTPVEASRAAGEGGVYTLAFGAVFKEPIKQLQTKTVGVKATELKGATEFYKATTKGQKTIVDRVTQFDTKTVRLKGADLDYYSRYNLETLQKARLNLAGSQRVKTISSDVAGYPEELTLFNQAAESTRIAQPVVAALKGENLMYGKVAQYTRGISKTTIKAAEGSVGTSSKAPLKPVTVLRKELVADANLLVDRPPVKFAARKYTTVKASGLIDEADTIPAAKALPTDIAQDIYKKMGGNYRPIIQPTQAKKLSGAMPKGTNEFYRKTVNALPDQPQTKAPIFSELKTVSTTKNVSLPRAITKVSTSTKTNVAPALNLVDPTQKTTVTQTQKNMLTPKTKQSYPQRTSIYQQGMDETETVYFTEPGQISKPTEFRQPKIKPTQEYKPSPQQFTSARQINMPTQKIIQTPKVTLKPQKSPTKIAPILTPKTSPFPMTGLTPFSKTKTTPITTAATSQRFQPSQLTGITTGNISPTTTRSVLAPPVFTPPYSHQRRKKTGGTFGLWRKQNNPVKTSAAMLKTFGILQGKPKRSAKVKRRKR